MKDHWSYDKIKHLDNNGEQWHFVWRSFTDENGPYEVRPVEIYFRNNTRTYFGLIRFERSKDNPNMYAKLVEKVMRDLEFRKEHEAQETKDVWLKSWK